MSDALEQEADTIIAAEQRFTAERMETRLTVRELMARMPPERRALLILFYVQGLSESELAGVFGIAKGTVKSRLHHARAALKAEFEKQVSDPCSEYENDEVSDLDQLLDGHDQTDEINSRSSTNS